MGDELRRGAVMTRICWWLTDLVSRMLEPDEREAALGDIAESGETGLRALRDILGLTARRQAGLWQGWRPWLALTGVVIPIGMVLTLAARRTADHSAIYFWLYVNNWDPAFIENSTFRHDLVSLAAEFLLGYLMLACWSWTGGLALGFLSRGATPVNGVLFFLTPTLTEMLGSPLFQRGRDFGANAAVFAVPFYRVIFPLVVQLVLILLPALWGMRQGIRLPAHSAVRRAVLRVAAIATVAAIGLQGWVWWGHVFFHMYGWPRFLTYWPAVYLAVNAIERIQSARFKENHA
jgi:hypothetical protein